MEKEKKSKLWATEIYEESVNKYYIDILTETTLPIAISPIHDKDIYTEYDYEKYKRNNEKEPNWKIGETKKPHRHILIEYVNTTTRNTILPIIEEIKGVGLIPIGNKKGYYEYLIHKNEKDKYQYKEEERINLNGFEIKEEEKQMTNEIKEEYKKLIIDHINEHDITEYKMLYDYVAITLPELKEIVSKNTIFFNAYLKSKVFVNQEKKLVTNKK